MTTFKHEGKYEYRDMNGSVITGWHRLLHVVICHNWLKENPLFATQTYYFCVGGWGVWCSRRFFHLFLIKGVLDNYGAKASERQPCSAHEFRLIHTIL